MEEEKQASTTFTEKRTDLTDFRPGDSIKVFYKITEGGKTRIQPYEGIVISKKGSGVSKTFTVRKIGADSIGVERIFPLHSPNIEKIEVIKKGKVRRAKLYYLREKVGREAMRIKERKEKPVK
jgi:large subunit ribosomal protein L19